MTTIPSKTDIANLALTKIGARRISDFTGDTTLEADTIRALYDTHRRWMLRRQSWKFAIARILLSQSAIRPPGAGAGSGGNIFTVPYAYYYPLPTDFLRLIPDDPKRSNTPHDWLVESMGSGLGQAIATNDLAPLMIRYIRDEENVAVYDPCFVEALACRIAKDAIVPLKQSVEQKQVLIQEYKDAVADAMRLDAIENGPTESEQDEWVYIRNTGISGATAGDTSFF